MKSSSDKGLAFFQAIIGDFKTANVLICCFAKPRERWQAAYDDNKKMIESVNNEAVLSFQNANQENFIDQVDWADVLVFLGGSTKDLIDKLRKAEGWEKNLTHKIVVGSSAGAYMLSWNYLITGSVPRLAPGLGLLPVVIATHYRSTFIHNGDIDKSRIFWDKVDKLMELEANGREVVVLKEGDFLIL